MDYNSLLRCFLPFVAILVVALILSLNVMPKFDRARIREHIEEHGGKVVEIIRVLGTGYDRGYKVAYVTPRGEQVKAVCKTSLRSGVYWVSGRPPGLFADENEPARTC